MTADDGVRWATAEDDAALRRLCVRTPMHGAVSYCLEREPEFFALTRLQGDAGGRVAVIRDGAEIAAMAMMARCRTWIDGLEVPCAYVGDLKVDPQHRRGGLAGRLVRFLAEELRRERIDRLFFLTLAGNRAMRLIDDSPGHLRVSTLGTVRNYLVPFGSAKRLTSDAGISRAKPDSIPEMIAFWNRTQRVRSFAPVLDDTLLSHWLTRLNIGDFRLLHRHGELKAICAVWDASAIKQIRLIRLSRGMRVATAFYNVANRIRGRARFPEAGERLRFLYVTHVCAETADDLEALLLDIHNEYREEGYLYLDLALDRGDPLTAALTRFRPMTVDFELRESRIAEAEAPAVAHPAYFDVSLV